MLFFQPIAYKSLEIMNQQNLQSVLENSPISFDIFSYSSILLPFLISEEISVKKSLEEALQLNKRLLLLQMMKTMTQENGQFFDKCNEEVEAAGQKQMRSPEFKEKNVYKISHVNVKNDTKNIPKNFGTAICIHIKKNPVLVKKLLSREQISYTHFLHFIKKTKVKLNSLIDLRKIWSAAEEDPQYDMKHCFRIISFDFMRRHCFPYIFDSRIKNMGSHIRYRKKILEGMKKPAELTNLKDY